jgi:hypothetical protein
MLYDTPAFTSTQAVLADALVAWLTNAETSGYANWFAAHFDTGRDLRARVRGAAADVIRLISDHIPTGTEQPSAPADCATVALLHLRDAARALYNLASIDEVGVDAVAAAAAAVAETEQVQAARQAGYTASLQAGATFGALGRQDLHTILQIQAAACCTLRVAAFKRLALAWRQFGTDSHGGAGV